MNMNRLINMGLRLLMNKGVRLAANRGKRSEDITPHERQQARSAQKIAGKAQKGIHAARRFMR